MKELASLSMSASSNAITLSHNILPRVLPFYHHRRKTYGATFIIWFGANPRISISDPDLIREIFINVKGDDYFEKVESPALVKMVEGDGLLALKGEKWAQHRRVIMPTFHLQNLKLMIPNMVSSMGRMLDEWRKMMISNDFKVEIDMKKKGEPFSSCKHVKWYTPRKHIKKYLFRDTALSSSLNSLPWLPPTCPATLLHRPPPSKPLPQPRPLPL